MIMGVAAIFGMFAGTFYWFPKMFGRMMNETLGKIHFYITFLGVYAIFTPMHWLGIAGNPRRYSDFTNFDFLGKLLPVHNFMTQAAYRHRRHPDSVLHQSFLEHEKRQEGAHESVERDHAGMDHPLAAALR